MLILVVAAGGAPGNVAKDFFRQPRPRHAVPGQVRLPPGVECRNPLAGMPSNHALNCFTAAAFLGLAPRRRAAAIRWLPFPRRRC